MSVVAKIVRPLSGEFFHVAVIQFIALRDYAYIINSLIIILGVLYGWFS